MEDDKEVKNLYASIRIWLEKHRELGYMDVYSAVCSDEDRFKVTLKIVNENNALHLPQSTDGRQEFPEKDEVMSQHFGRSADKILKSKSLNNKKDILLEKCIKALVYAPTDSKEVALSYGRRAHALLLARLYQDAINDVEKAFQHGCPPSLKTQLSLVEAKCLVALHGAKSSLALEAIKKTRKLSKMNEHFFKKAKTTIALTKLCTDVFKDPLEVWNDQAFVPVVHKDERKNSEIPEASPAITVCYTAKYGRHLVATEDIEIGQVLAVEKPYAAVLELNRRHINCWYCLRQTWSGIPCDTCVNVIYCNQDCKEMAWKNFHDYECDVLGIFLIQDFNVGSLMSIRLLIKALKEYGGWQQFKERVEELNNCSDFRMMGFTSGVLDSTKYASAGTLTGNTEKRSKEDLFTLSVGSVMITYILATKTKLFGRKFAEFDGKSLQNDWIVSFAGGIILKHLQIHAINAQMSCEWDSKENNSFTRAMVLIPLYGLINHRCNPSVAYTSHGTFVALHAIRSIKKGEQIFDHRGLHYTDTPRNIRQLKRREDNFFFCECIACQENWPLFEDLPSYNTMNLNSVVQKQLDEIMSVQNFSIIKNPSMLEIRKVILPIIDTIINNLKVLLKYLQQPCREIDEVTKSFQNIYHQISSRCQSLDE